MVVKAGRAPLGLAIFLLLAAPSLTQGASWPSRGGQAILGSPSAIVSLDPIRALTQAELALADALHCPLFRPQPGGEPIPLLLDGPMAVSDDGRAVVLTLRKGLTFHDGRPLTAQDVVRSWTRLLEPGRSPHWWLLGALEGAVAFHEGQASSVVGLRSRGRREVILRLSFALPALDRLLSAAPTAILPKGDEERVGLGPMSLSGESQGVELKALSSDPLGGPFLDKITLRPFPADKDHVVAFELGQIQASFKGESLYGRGAKKIREARGPAGMTVYLGVRPHHPLAAPKAIEGLSRAVDRPSLVRFATKGQGKATADLVGDGPSPTRDVAQARTLLSRALPPGHSINMLVDGSDDLLAAVAQRLQVNLLDAGIQVRILKTDAATFQRLLLSGEYDLYVSLFVPLSPDPTVAALDEIGRFNGQAAVRFMAGRERPTSGPWVALVRLRPQAHYRPPLRGVMFDERGVLVLRRLWVP